MRQKMKLFILLLIAISFGLSGCCLFEYKCTMEPVWTTEQVAEIPVQPEGSSVIPSLPVTGNPVYDFVLNIVGNSGAVNAAQVLAIAVAGDPASITAWQGKAAYKVSVTKRLFVIESKGQINANK
jgi:hypothetical protein